MKQSSLQTTRSLVNGLCIAAIACMSFTFPDSPLVNQVVEERSGTADTIPVKPSVGKMTMEGLDKAMKELDLDMKRLSEDLKKLDLEKISRGAELALHEVDFEKIMKEVETSIKEVDVEKILSEVKASLNNLDENTDASVKLALEEAQIQLKQASKEISQINTAEIKKSLEQARAEVKKATAEVRQIDVEKIMKDAEENIKDAKEELFALKDMFKEMESDKLIDPKKGFKIDWKGNKLFINGQEQGPAVTEKYKRYFKKDSLSIEIEKED